MFFNHRLHNLLALVIIIPCRNSFPAARLQIQAWRKVFFPTTCHDSTESRKNKHLPVLIRCRSKRFLIPCRTICCSNTFLKCTLCFYNAELYPILEDCGTIIFLKTLLNYTPLQYIAEFYLTSIYCQTQATIFLEI